MEQKLDKIKYIKRVIIVCWVALALCFIIKLFGGNFFQIICDNQTFIAICEFCDNNWWAYYLIGAIYCFVSLYFFTLAILQRTKFKFWELIIVIVTVLIGSAIKILNPPIGFVFDIWQFIGMPMVFLGKNFKRYLDILISNILLIVFQLASMFIRNIPDIVLTQSGTLVNTIFSIDIVIMVVLFFAYANLINSKKENKDMGLFFGWFQKDNVAELKKDREKLVAKKGKIDEKIKAIDKWIAELESRDKGSN